MMLAELTFNGIFNEDIPYAKLRDDPTKMFSFVKRSLYAGHGRDIISSGDTTMYITFSDYRMIKIEVHVDDVLVCSMNRNAMSVHWEYKNSSLCEKVASFCVRMLNTIEGNDLVAMKMIEEQDKKKNSKLAKFKKKFGL